MLVPKYRIGTAILLAAGLIAGVAGTLALRPVAAPRAASERDAPGAPGTPGSRDALRAGGDEPADDVVEVKGRVEDPEGKPLSGAKVYLAPNFWAPGDRAKSTARATSGGDGRFQFTFQKSEVNSQFPSWFDDGWRNTSIVAVAEGFGPQWVEAGSVTKEALTLRLVKDDVPIEGRVLDLEGRPVAGAVVSLLGLMAAADEDLTDFLKTHRQKKQVSLRDIGFPETLTTGEEGRFRLTGIGRERVVALNIGGPTLATDGGFALSRRGVDVTALNLPPEAPVLGNPHFPYYGDRFDHRVAPTKPFAGTVREKDTGKALAGIRVGLNGTAEHPHRSFGPIEAVTDENGHYRLVGWRKANGYSIAAGPRWDEESAYLGQGQSVADTEDVQPITVDFELTRGVVVTGRLLDRETGKRARGSIVYRALDDNKNVDTRRTQKSQSMTYTRPDGSFRLVILPGPGVVLVENTLGGRFIRARLDPADKAKGYPDNLLSPQTQAYRLINAKPGDERLTCGDLELVPGKTRNVSIVGPDGKPLAGTSVQGVSALGETQTLDKPTFTAIGLNPDRPRRLTFLHGERRLAGTVTLRGDETEPVTVKLQPWGTVTGRVLDKDGQPLAGARVVLSYQWEPLESPIPARPSDEALLTDRDGRFRVEGLVPGLTYDIHASKTRLTGFQRTVFAGVTVEAGQTNDLGTREAKPLD